MRKIPVRLTLMLLSLALASRSYAGFSPKQISKKMGKGVVFIAATDAESSDSTCGTGSIVDESGLVLTNAHVIYNKEADKPHSVIRIFLKPDKLVGDVSQDLAVGFDAELLHYDTALDLALLQIKGAPKSLTILLLGNPDDLEPGDETVAIGHPEQGGLWTVTTGVLSAQIHNQNGVRGRDVWQMETSLNRGNSGGPLFDPRGYVIGVNTSIARRATDGMAITGINFALKSSVPRKWLVQYGIHLNYGPLPLEGAGEVAEAAAAPTTAVEDIGEPPALDQEKAEAETEAVEVRNPIHFKQDLEQQLRPYKMEEVSTFMKRLGEKRDSAVEELEGTAGNK